MSPRVLFVDDEPHVTEALKRALRKEPYEVLTAQSAAEALQVMAEAPAEVVIADEKMPGMSGSEFLRLIRQHYPDTIRMILTGHATLDAAIRAVNEGEIYRFFTKPCNDADLVVTIRHALERQQLFLKARELLGVVRSQTAELDQLEQLYPGISKVKRDEQGVIVMEEPPPGISFAKLMQEIDKTLRKEPSI